MPPPLPGQELSPNPKLHSLWPTGGNVDGKFSVGYRDAIVRTVVSLDRETTAAYTLILEAIGMCQPALHTADDFPAPQSGGFLLTC